MKMEGQTGHGKRSKRGTQHVHHYLHYTQCNISSFVKVTQNLPLENFVKIFYCLINIKVLHHTLKKKFLSYIHIPFNRQHCKG